MIERTASIVRLAGEPGAWVHYYRDGLYSHSQRISNQRAGHLELTGHGWVWDGQGRYHYAPEGIAP